MTLTQFMLHEARMSRKRTNATESSHGSERDLHSKIFAECRLRGWIALHGAMSERTHRTMGEWDFTILADQGRVFFVECKTATGKLRSEQAGLIAWAKKLGHDVRVVRSINEFVEWVTKLKS